jgi:hypothetical protein
MKIASGACAKSAVARCSLSPSARIVSLRSVVRRRPGARSSATASDAWISSVSRSVGAAVPGGSSSTCPASATPETTSVAAVAPRTPNRIATQMATGKGRYSSGEWTSPRTLAK